MNLNRYYDYISQFGDNRKRSMFGGCGLFLEGAMYALVVKDCLYIRGGGSLDDIFESLGCKRYRHIKKQTITTVNYFNVTHLYDRDYPDLENLIKESIQESIRHRKFMSSFESRRLRDLPNMQLTLERMVKRSGISDVNTFISLGAAKVFSLVQKEYGDDVDIRLLWKFAGAVEGVHWTLLQEHKKKALLSDCDYYYLN